MARPDYNRGSLMIATVHISPRSEAIRIARLHSSRDTLPQLLFFYTLQPFHVYIYRIRCSISTTTSLRFNRRIFHRYSCGLFHLLFFFFLFFTSSLPSFFSLFSQSGSGTPNFVRRRQIGNILRHEI